MMFNYAKLNDISKWQETADFSVMLQKSCGVILRAGPDNGTWEDRRFIEWRNQAENSKFPYGNYWYYLGNIPPKQQAVYWSNVIGDRHGALGCWLDLEHSLAHENNTYLKWWDCIAYFKQLQPSAAVGIYTRASYFNDPQYKVPANHAFRNLPLWVAHYDVDKPDMPKGWKDWTFWQYSERGDGHAHGVHSHRIDMNYFNGTKGDFAERYGKTGFPYIGKYTANMYFSGQEVIYKE